MSHVDISDIDNLIVACNENAAKGLVITSITVELDKENFERVKEEARVQQRLDYGPDDDRCTRFRIDEAIIFLNSQQSSD